MRIIDSIAHSSYKISIFHLNNKHVLKIENGPYEQIYKFKEETPVKAIKQSVSPSFLDRVAAIFEQMHQNKMGALNYPGLVNQNDVEEIL